MFGSCGSLEGERTRGKYIVPTEAYRGEGASYYYAPPADYIAIKTADKLAAISQLADRGLMTRNELRDILNLSPLPEPYGDQIPARGEYYNVNGEAPAE